MAKVYIWSLDMFHPCNKSNKSAGHSSLLLDGTTPSQYISWWPKESASLTRPSTDDHLLNTFDEDVDSEGRDPSETIILNCLNEDIVSSWWQSVQATGFSTPYKLQYVPGSKSYDLYTNNCSTIVFLALVIGTPDTAWKKWVFPDDKSALLGMARALVTPSDIRDYAKRLKTYGG